MAEFTNDDLGLRFTLPDNPTVGQQLRYRGRVFATGYFTEDVYLRMWLGFLGLYGEWGGMEAYTDGETVIDKDGNEILVTKYRPCEVCESVPDPKAVDLETETNPAVADIVQYVGNVTARHMNTLETVPKN